MVIKHAQQSLVNTPATAAKPAAKTTQPSGFAALFGSLTPKSSAPATNYSPVGIIRGTGATQTATTVASSNGASPGFTAVFQQGGTVTGPDGSQAALNSDELADAPTAQEVAALLGGTVTQDNMAGGFTSSIDTLEISVPGSSNEVNAGLAAKLFSTYGTAQGSEAWQIINSDLGRG